MHHVEELATSVSHPELPPFGKHYNPSEIVHFIPLTPSEVTIDSGFPRDRLRLSAKKGWISMHATVSEVENLLITDYHVYAHLSGGYNKLFSSLYFCLPF